MNKEDSKKRLKIKIYVYTVHIFCIAAIFFEEEEK
jgi:hypothetical protein